MVGYPEHLRISVGAPDQNARLLAALDRALAG
jgi:histidinol-phosphate/aromatic aminotransferase/cobyric acid decarboxylase-like protein